MSNIEKIEIFKQQLNKLIILEESILHEGEILQLSQELDKFIVNYLEDEEDIETSLSKNDKFYI